jgi:hypothetical protein
LNNLPFRSWPVIEPHYDSDILTAEFVVKNRFFCGEAMHIDSGKRPLPRIMETLEKSLKVMELRFLLVYPTNVMAMSVEA